MRTNPWPSFVALVAMSCGAPRPAEPLRPRPLLVEQPAPRAHDEEEDAWRSPSDRTPPEPPAVVCPPGATWRGDACVIHEFRCPHGTTRVGEACMGAVRCPPGTAWIEDACFPTTPPPAPSAVPGSPASTGTCLLDINAIPSCSVFVDGISVGTTPQLARLVSAGMHTVVFVNELRTAKRVVTVGCRDGERKAVTAKVLEGEAP